MTARCEPLKVGYISGLHGVSGWVKVFSYTDPPDNIFNYQPWSLEQGMQRRTVSLVDAKRHGSGLIARLQGIDDRDAAAPLVGATITVPRDRLPVPSAGQYYWADLVGLEVVNSDGQKLGVIQRLFETGANDVMVVTGDRQRLIPWLTGDVITDVDLVRGRITVQWDPDF